jgi:hypothetical protein
VQIHTKDLTHTHNVQIQTRATLSKVKVDI